MIMESKEIMLCNGPLSGQYTIVEGHALEYRFFEEAPNSMHDVFPEGVLSLIQRLYRKSKYKFGLCEIFIWEEDFK